MDRYDILIKELRSEAKESVLGELLTKSADCIEELQEIVAARQENCDISFRMWAGTLDCFVNCLRKLEYEMYNCERGDSYMIIDGKTYSTDTAYATDGILIFMEVLENRLVKCKKCPHYKRVTIEREDGKGLCYSDNCEYGISNNNPHFYCMIGQELGQNGEIMNLTRNSAK